MAINPKGGIRALPAEWQPRAPKFPIQTRVAVLCMAYTEMWRRV